MRHPFWRWLGWLSIGLSGCLHGQDWRAAVTKPMTRSVADRHESLPQPKVVGPFRSEPSKFVPPAKIATTPAMAARPATTNRSSQAPTEIALPAVAKPEPQTRLQQATPAAQDVSNALPVAADSVIVAPPQTGPYAEFERTIPLRRSVVAKPKAPRAKPAEAAVVEKNEPERSPPRTAPALPIITPAGAVSAKPATVQDSRSRSLESEISSADNPSRGQVSTTAAPAKEVPDVTDATHATANDSSATPAEPAARPQDVSLLVEQVFEDLRQRRMNDARQRTEWLKQLVRNRASAVPSTVVAETPPVESEDRHSDEPRRLEVDPQATAIDKPVTKSFFDDEEPTN